MPHSLQKQQQFLLCLKWVILLTIKKNPSAYLCNSEICPETASLCNCKTSNCNFSKIIKNILQTQKSLGYSMPLCCVSECAQYGMKTSNIYALDLYLITNVSHTVVRKPESFFTVEICNIQHWISHQKVSFHPFSDSYVECIAKSWYNQWLKVISCIIQSYFTKKNSNLLEILT